VGLKTISPEVQARPSLGGLRGKLKSIEFGKGQKRNDLNVFHKIRAAGRNEDLGGGKHQTEAFLGRGSTSHESHEP